MPIQWTALPETRRVDAIGSGTVCADDWRHFIDSMNRGGIRGYAKLLDLSHARFDISAAEIQGIAGVINQLADDGAEPLGPAAFVIDSAAALERLMQFDDRTGTGHRPMAIFPSRQLALDWLDTILPNADH